MADEDDDAGTFEGGEAVMNAHVKNEEDASDAQVAGGHGGGFAPAVKQEKTKSGFAKLQEIDDWRAMRDAAAEEAAEQEDAEGEGEGEGKAKMERGSANATGAGVDLPLEEDGSLNMFWMDAYEDPSNKGRIYMFGKVRTGEGKGGGAYASCCLQIDNLQRQVFILPRKKILDAEVPCVCIVGVRACKRLGACRCGDCIPALRPPSGTLKTHVGEG